MKTSMKSIVLAAVCASQLGFAAEPESNRKAKPSIFTRTGMVGPLQVMVGTGEMIGAGALFRQVRSQVRFQGPSPEAVRLQFAQLTLDAAENSLTAEEAQALRKQLKEEIAYLHRNGKVDIMGKAVTPEAEKELKRIQSFLNEIDDAALSPGVTNQQMVAFAKEQVEEAQKAILSKPSVSKYAKSIKYFKVVGGVLLAVDAVGRFFVWKQLDGEPTISPSYSALAKLGKKILSKPSNLDPNEISKQAPASLEGEQQPTPKQASSRDMVPRESTQGVLGSPGDAEASTSN